MGAKSNIVFKRTRLKNVNLCQLDIELKNKHSSITTKHYTCMGCCGHSFKSREEMKQDLVKNTLRFLSCFEGSKANKKLNKEKLKHLGKENEKLASSGICKSLVFNKDKTKVFCCVHKEQINNHAKKSLHGNDFRDKECNKNYLCQTSREFKTWNNSKKKEFLRLILKTNPDWYRYSIKIDNGDFLAEFLQNIITNKE